MTKIRIRPLKLDDIDELLEVSGRFLLESNYKDIPCNEEKLAYLYRRLVINPNGLALVYTKQGKIIGGFFAEIVGYYFSDALLAQEIAWYIDRDNRGTGAVAAKTLDIFRRWAEAMGAREAVVATSTGIEVERTNKLLQRCGWEQVGTVNKFRG